MTLKEFRKRFVDVTGRFDLIVDEENYEDNGANYYINAGQRMLDSMFTHKQSKGVVTLETQSGVESYGLKGMLSVEKVRLQNADSDWVNLIKQEEEDLEVLQVDGTGLPCYYAVAPVLRNPMLGNAKQDFMKLAITLRAIPDGAYALEIKGKVTTVLKSENDYSFWTVNYPETLISAAQYFIERGHRNTQGARDHLTAIHQDLRNLEGDVIESDVADRNQMNDSFKFRGQGNAR